MAFVEEYLLIAPTWAEKCQSITLYRLLLLLQDGGSTHVSARINFGTTYLVVVRRREPYSGFSHWKLPARLWLCVHHICTVNPSQCSCWCCKWRKLRRVFHDPRNFDHVFIRHGTTKR